jgi:cobyrinic acid a,c-diamide synthase
MVKTTVPRILVAGSGPQAGKSLAVLGLLVALRKQGLSVSCCITGESLHLGLVYSRITRRYTRVLDRAMLGRSELLSAIYQASLGADIVIIDGQGGLFDGRMPGSIVGSDAEIAAMTGTPVIVVHEPADLSAGIVPLVRSMTGRADGPNVVGLIANRLPANAEGDPFLPHPGILTLNRHLEAENLPAFIGGIPFSSAPLVLPASELSQEENCTSLPRQLFIDAGNLAHNHIEIDLLRKLASMAAPLEVSPLVEQPSSRLCRFAVTDDSCFNLCYQDNLDLIRYCGAEIVAFSPLADSALPRRVGGLYVTGAYLKSYGEDLSRNNSLRRSIKQFADAGGVVYSEGAGTAYLCRSFQLEKGGPTFPGVGLIPADAFPVPQQRSSVDVETVDDSVLGFSGLALRGISTGEWALGGRHTGAGHHIVSTFRVQMPGREPVHEGYSATSQSCSTFHFLHFASNPLVAKSLVEAAQVFERTLPDRD